MRFIKNSHSSVFSLSKFELYRWWKKCEGEKRVEISLKVVRPVFFNHQSFNFLVKLIGYPCVRTSISLNWTEFSEMRGEISLKVVNYILYYR